MLFGAGASQLGPFFIGKEKVDARQVLHGWLEGVHRREHPGDGTRAFRRIGGQQRGASLTDVHDDGARLEQRQAVLLVHRHLAEGLQCAVCGRILFAHVQELFLVGEAGFLESPANSQVVHQALGEVRYPSEGGETNVWHGNGLLVGWALLIGRCAKCVELLEGARPATVVCFALGLRQLFVRHHHFGALVARQEVDGHEALAFPGVR